VKLRPGLFVGGALAALVVTNGRHASACGGCFVPPEENTQVTGHRMLLSISPRQTTLWDQITYSGDPASFAWVLPINGKVDIGLSSDALFAFIEQLTVPRVSPPPLNCPALQLADKSTQSAHAATAEGDNSGDGVQVIAQQVVGPYETVQLSA